VSWILDSIEKYAAELESIGVDENAAPPPAPRWNQDWFPRLDAAAAYAVVRESRPRRIIEVGSGHSTRFLARAVADGGLKTRITAIDPEPRAKIDGLRVEFLDVPVQQTEKSIFFELQGDDILFIDSSHQLKPGSDVEFLFDEVLPALPGGVLVHFHDIFLPDGYPPEWAWRRYNEQEAVAALVDKGLLREEFSSHRAARERSGVLARLPLLPGAHESSLWLRKN
jgi:predicted O-methyltransferase YrrM